MNNINSHVGNVSENGIDAGDINTYIQDWTVEQLNKAGDVVKSYTFRGCFPTGVDEIALDFGSTDTIETFGATIRYQYWTSNTTDNVG